jgi:hypothetical protein
VERFRLNLISQLVIPEQAEAKSGKITPHVGCLQGRIAIHRHQSLAPVVTLFCGLLKTI